MKKLVLMSVLVLATQTSFAARNEGTATEDGSLNTFQSETEQDMNRGSADANKLNKRNKNSKAKHKLDEDIKQSERMEQQEEKIKK